MNERLASLAIRLYPTAWRNRYGVEFEQLLRDEYASPLTLVNVLRAALFEHLFPTTQVATAGCSVLSLARKPSAMVPMLMSIAALAWLLGFLFLVSRGAVPLHTADGNEGLAARVWQLLILGQLPVVVWFGLRWLWQRPIQTLAVLAVQIAIALASLVPILILEG